MFYRHLHAESCVLSREGEEAPKSELQTLRDERDRLREALKALVSEVGSYTVERQYYSREQASKDLDRREKALLAQLQKAKAALTPAGQRWTWGVNT